MGKKVLETYMLLEEDLQVASEQLANASELFAEDPLTVSERPCGRWSRYHRVEKCVDLSVRWRTERSLPGGILLGKDVSLDFGIVHSTSYCPDSPIVLARYNSFARPTTDDGEPITSATFETARRRQELAILPDGSILLFDKSIDSTVRLHEAGMLSSGIVSTIETSLAPEEVGDVINSRFIGTLIAARSIIEG